MEENNPSLLSKKRSLNVNSYVQIATGNILMKRPIEIGHSQLQHVISELNLNGQIAEIFRKSYRYGEVSHSEKLRDAKGMKYYIEAEIERLEKYEL